MKVTRDKAQQLLDWYKKEGNEKFRLVASIYKFADSAQEHLAIELIKASSLENDETYLEPSWKFIFEVIDSYPYKEEG